MPAEPIFFDELHVGDRFTTDSLRVDADQIIAFAREFDPQPFHLDEQAAKASMFGGLAASGWHTAALTMKLLVGSGPPIAGGILGASMRIDWKAPTRPDDELRVEAVVVSCTPSSSRADRGMVVMECVTLNQKDSPLQKLTATLVVPRRAA